MTKAGTGVMQPRAPGHPEPWKPEEAGRTLPWSLRRALALRHPDFSPGNLIPDCRLPGWGENTFVLL